MIIWWHPFSRSRRMDDFKKEFADKFLNGDAAEYERLMAMCTSEEDKNYLRYGKRATISWCDIENQVKCHPHYEELALAFVRFILGYLPQQHAYLPSLAFLQTLTENFETGKISIDHFAREFFFYTKEIRNEDMKQGGWVQHPTYDEHNYQHYDTYLGQYKHQARDRLCTFLGYEPDLISSLDAEVFLRQLFESDDYYPSIPWCNADYIAGNVVKYRKAFLEKGVAAADNIDFVGRTIEEFKVFLESLSIESKGSSKFNDLTIPH